MGVPRWRPVPHGSQHGTQTFECSLVGHKIRSKDCKEETSFIPNGRVTVQGEGCKDYRTEWSLSPAIELPALQYNLF